MKLKIIFIIFSISAALDITAQNIFFSGGDSTSVFLCENGLVYLSGANSNGELGNSTTISSSKAGLTSGINGSGVLPLCSQVCFRDNSSCIVLTRTGDTVLTWGKNDYGQLGNSVTPIGSFSNTPQMVVGIGGIGYLNNIRQISGGKGNSYAVTKDSKVLSWGRNTAGENGDGTDTQRVAPVYVLKGPSDTLENVKTVCGGAHFCLALLDDGTVWGWGRNNYGQLAQNNNIDQSFAVQIKNSSGNGYLKNIIKIGARQDHALALSAEDTLWAWGNNNFGQLGINNTIPQSLPKAVSNPLNTGHLRGVTNISAGGGHNFAVIYDSSLYCWGNNSFGQVGINSTQTMGVLLPSRVLDISGNSPITKITKIAAGQDYSMAVNDSNKLFVWGNNTSGQLATGDHSSHVIPFSSTTLPFPCTIKYSIPVARGTFSGNITECSGNNHDSIMLSGYTGNVVAWQLSNDNFTNYIAIASSKPSYSYTNLSLTTYFRAVLEFNNNIFYTSSFVVYVDPPSNGTLPPSIPVCQGNNSGRLILSNLIGSIVRWESSTDNFNTSIPMVDSLNYFNFSNLNQNTYYRVMLKNGACHNDYSNVALVSVFDSSKGGVLKQDMTVLINNNHDTLSLSGYQGTIKYWESSPDNFSTIYSIVPNYSPVLPPANISSDTYYRVLIQSGPCQVAYSNSVLIHVVGTADTIKIKAYPTISPNNDFINDEWIIDRIDYFPNNEIKIYNRWGNIVYSEKGYDNKSKVWRGQSNAEAVIGGKDLPEGTYFYNINLGNGSSPQSGYVVLNR